MPLSCEEYGLLFTPGNSCELCGDKESERATCKMCGATVCSKCIEEDQGICFSCVEARCSICWEYLSSRACAICGELVCEEHGKRMNAAVVCDRCRKGDR